MDDLVGFVSPARWVGRPVVLRAETGSTNDDARALAAAGCPAGTLVLADAQRSGRGRRGRPWASPPGENLYASLVLRPAMEARRAAALALVAGAAVAAAVEPFAGGHEVRLKWPNDVRCDGRKLAGVLLEGSLRGDRLAYAVLGVGINVRGAAPPAGLEAAATTLRLLRGGVDLDRAGVLRALVLALEERLDRFDRDGFAALRDEVTGRCETLGRSVAFEGLAGVAEGIADDGALLLRDAAGALHAVRSGELA